MKRKLLFASFMLVFALVAVVASTYAWITMQTEAEVSQIDLDVVTGEELQISTNGESYGYRATVTVPADSKLNTVTFVRNEEAEFGFDLMKLDYDEDAKQYNLVKGAQFTDGAGEYLQYDLYFRTSLVDQTLFLNYGESSVTSTEGEVHKFSRIAFFVHGADELYILEPAKDENNTYGVGTLFDPEESTVPLNAFEQYVRDNDEDGVYELINPETNYETVDDEIVLGLLEADEAQKVTVFVWLEGWDGDSKNVPEGTQLHVNLKFGIRE